MKEAMFYNKLSEGKVQCLLCPHNCNIPEESHGVCGVRKNIDGKLFSLNYGKITSAAYDPIEKKPIYNFHRGSKIFSIGSFGCNFKCDFCQNYEIVQSCSYYKEVSIERMLEFAKDESSIGIAYTYNEPTVWYEFMHDIAIRAREIGLYNVVVTNGYINEAPLRMLLPYIDAMNIDLKSFSNEFYKKICGGSLDPVKRTIEIAAEHTHVEVTTLLIDNENEEDIEEIAKFLSSIDEDIVLHISRYFPRYKRDNPATKLESLFNSEKIAKKYLNNVYIGNI